MTPGSFYFYVDELARFYCYLSSETVRRGGGGGDRKPWWQLYLPLLSLLSKQFLKKEQKSYKLKRHNRTNEQTQFQFGQTME